MHRLGKRGTRAGLTLLLLLAIAAGVVLVHQTPQGPVLGKVVIDSDNALFTPTTHIALDGPAQRALVVNTTSNAVTLGSVNNGPGSWDSQVESETTAAPAGTLIDTRTGSRPGQIPFRGIVHLLAVDGQAGHFVAVDATPGAQTVTVIDATRGSSQRLRFTTGRITPVFVASAVDERRGHLLATTLLSPTTDGLTQDRGVAMFDTHSGRLLHLTFRAAQAPGFSPGVSHARAGRQKEGTQGILEPWGICIGSAN